jgi:hypothetical protein
MIFSEIFTDATITITITDIEELLMIHNNDEFMTELRSLLASFVADVARQNETMDTNIRLHTHISYDESLRTLNGSITRLKTKVESSPTREELNNVIARISDVTHTC